MKREIIYGAIRVFSKKGVKFTMDDLSSEVGMSKRTIYETLRSKEDVLRLIINEVYDGIKRQESEILNNNELDKLTKLKMVIPVLPQSFNTIDYTRIYEVKKFYPSIYEEILRRLESDWEPTLKLMQECMDEGLIRTVDTSIVKGMVIGCITHLIDNDELYRKHSSYEDSLNVVVDIIFNGLVIDR